MGRRAAALNPHGPLFSASLSERSRRGSSHVRKVFECVHVCGQATVRIKKEGANRIKLECVQSEFFDNSPRLHGSRVTRHNNYLVR